MTSTIKLDDTFYTCPSVLKKLVTPEALRIRGNFYVSDALNFLKELGIYDGLPLEDGESYSLARMKVHPLLGSDPDIFQERTASLYIVQGDVATQGAAIAVAVGDLKKQQAESPYGVLIRDHSACANSEAGRLFAGRLYNVYKDDRSKYSDGSKWFYDNSEDFMSPFIKYGGGIIAGYPKLGRFERSLDCDCRTQRELAQSLIATAGGVYISLAGDAQEGRGLGQANKEKIYKLQEEQGLSSARACDVLGLPRDVRDYRHSFSLLKKLNINRVGLMTNNLDKLHAFEAAGFEVKRVPLVPAHMTQTARQYVATKGKELNHDVTTRSTFIFEGGRLLTIEHSPAHLASPDVMVVSSGKASFGFPHWRGKNVLRVYNSPFPGKR